MCNSAKRIELPPNVDRSDAKNRIIRAEIGGYSQTVITMKGCPHGEVLSPLMVFGMR